MKRQRQRHDRATQRRRARTSTKARAHVKQAAELRQEQVAQGTIALAELAKGRPCLLCHGAPDKVALSIAEPGSALLPANAKVSMRRIPYALCTPCSQLPSLKSRIEEALVRALREPGVMRIKVDHEDNVRDVSTEGGIDGQ